MYSEVKRWRLALKAKIVAGFGGRCAICGVSDEPSIYDCHHRDPKSKDFAVGSKIRRWPTVVAELAKCVLLCANCHRKVHAGAAVIPEDAPCFDEALVSVKESPTDACPICGEQKIAVRKYCSIACLHEQTRRTASVKQAGLAADF